MPNITEPTELRKIEFRDYISQNNPDKRNAIPICAYLGIHIKNENLDSLINKMLIDETGDFKLTQLVRVLYFTNEYDEKILPAIKKLNFWLTKGEDQYCYWSENHMILWTSSAYLLKQREGWSMDENMESRLRHLLDLKLKYGFYEFFSSTYLPYSLAPLLNLADFASDPEIKNKAAQAAKIILRNWLLMVNDKGVRYPAAGRNYAEQYTEYRQSSITWITTGIGSMRTSSDYAGGFLSTSSIDLKDSAASWKSESYTKFSFGHSQKKGKKINKAQTRVNRTIFQWSSGGYLHPDVANDTVWLVDSYNLENNHFFSAFKYIPDFPDKWANVIGKIAAVFTRGSDISHAKVRVYKNKGVVLSSLINFYPGYRGYQEWPWAASIDDISIFTQAQDIRDGWDPKSRLSSNTHLPKIKQNQNAALIIYNPKLEIRTLQMLGKYDTYVTLHWPSEKFDKSIEWKHWIIGQKGNSYAAVYRDSTKKRNGNFCSNSERGRQMWAIVVGNKDTHGSFDNFENIVKKSSIKKTYKFDCTRFRKVYYTRIKVDGKTIKNKW